MAKRMICSCSLQKLGAKCKFLPLKRSTTLPVKNFIFVTGACEKSLILVSVDDESSIAGKSAQLQW